MSMNHEAHRTLQTAVKIGLLKALLEAQCITEQQFHQAMEAVRT